MATIRAHFLRRYTFSSVFVTLMALRRRRSSVLCLKRNSAPSSALIWFTLIVICGCEIVKLRLVVQKRVIDTAFGGPSSYA